jgi:hypothetical protein
MKKLLLAILLLPAAAFGQNGRTVSGVVTPAPGAAAAAAKAVRVGIISSGNPAQTREAVVNADGTFRVSEVPPGPHLVRLLPVNANNRSEAPYPAQGIFVGDRDITGLLLTGPHLIMGRVVIEGGGRLPLSPNNPRPETAILGNIEIRPLSAPVPTNGRGASPFLSSGVRVDHTFVVAAPSGEYRITATFPASFSVRSMTYGSVNLLQDSLKLGGPAAAEMVITLTQAPGFSVRGRVTGRPAAPLPPGVGVATPGANAQVNDDGTFELRGIPAGNRAVNLTRIGASPLSGQTTLSRLATTNVTVVDRDIENIELQWRPLTPLTGQLVQLDKNGSPIPGVPPGVNVTLTARNGQPIAGGCDYTGCRADILTLAPQPDGSLNRAYPLLVPPTVADVAVSRLLPGYVVKAITSGAVDLLKNPLQIDATTAAADIQVVLQNMSGARVAGRVVTSRETPLVPERISLVAGPGILPGIPPSIQSAVARDGTFSFTGVAPGVYTLASNPNGLAFFGSTTTNIVVSNEDLTNVPLVGLSDAYIPNTLQYANEAAAVLNINAIQQAETYYNGLHQRYGTLQELIAAGFLSPGYARAASGYTFFVTTSGADISGAALPTTAADGRYEFYFARNGGARALRLTGPPANEPRTVSLNTLEQAATCGTDVPLCLRIGPTGQQGTVNVFGRVRVVTSSGNPLPLPNGVFVGVISASGTGTLTSPRSDGSFQVATPRQASEHRVVVENLPAGYRVKSIQGSGVDLLNGVLTNTASALEVTLETR